MLSLHRDLFIGLPGELFMGMMALLFVVAIVSGVVAYGPFMRRLKFGTVRNERSSRLRWLDLHNLLGLVTPAWALVVVWALIDFVTIVVLDSGLYLWLSRRPSPLHCLDDIDQDGKARLTQPAG